MDLGLKGKVAIITGGSDGVGKAAAMAMAREGAKVALAARRVSLLNEAVAEITDHTGGEIIGISTDVGDEESVQRLINEVVAKWGGIDILVNNAGTSSAVRLEEMSNERVAQDLQVKVYGAIYCMRHALAHLRHSGSGAVVNITTPGGKASPGGSQPTSLSRAAGISLTKAWSKELACDNIRVNTICLGLLKSGQHRSRWEALHAENPQYSLDDHWEAVGKDVPLGRVGEASEAGDVVAFLCSARASYVSGASINVDGASAPVV